MTTISCFKRLMACPHKETTPCQGFTEVITLIEVLSLDYKKTFQPHSRPPEPDLQPIASGTRMPQN